MLALALRGLAARKLRGVLTAFAILLGVAMVAGTFMLKGSVDKAFDDIFAEANAGIDVTVKPSDAFDSGDIESGAGASRVTGRARSRASTGVEKAAGSIADPAAITILDEEGERIGQSGGAPQLAQSVAPRAVQPVHLDRGRRRRRPTTRSRSTRSPPTRRATRSASRSRSAAGTASRTTR